MTLGNYPMDLTQESQMAIRNLGQYDSNVLFELSFAVFPGYLTLLVIESSKCQAKLNDQPGNDVVSILKPPGLLCKFSFLPKLITLF